MEKRNFIKSILFFLCMYTVTYSQGKSEIPSYLKEYSSVYAKQPKQAALQWFKDAGFGMFVHFSPASQLAGGTDEWMRLDNWFQQQKDFESMSRDARKNHLIAKMTQVSSNVERLIYSFNPVSFNADSIADLAVKAGMRYITFTTQHVIGKMYMYDTSLSKWNSKNLLGRDFVQELSIACEKRGLGLFLYVTPPNNNLQAELKIMLRELLSNYGSIAGIWFDGIGECYRRPNEFMEVGRLYDYIRQIQPQCLISFKTGYTGDEDFIAPEWNQVKFSENKIPLFTIDVPADNGISLYKEKKLRTVLRITPEGLVYKQQNFRKVWEEELSKKPVELSNTLLENMQWFNVKNGVHKDRTKILGEYRYAKDCHANYILNVALEGDGSIHPSDYQILEGLKNEILSIK